MLPTGDVSDAVRAPIDAATAKGLLDYLVSCEGKSSRQWKVRNARNEKALTSGDPKELVQVYKSLCLLQNETGRLGVADRRHLQTAFDLLVEEMAIAMGEPQETVRSMILERCAAEDVLAA